MVDVWRRLVAAMAYVFAVPAICGVPPTAAAADWPISVAAAAKAGMPMPLDYEAYVRDFNTGNDDGLVEKYFAPDTVMTSASGEYRGHEGMKEFLAWAHDGVREIIRPQVVTWDENHIFAEVDMDFVASKPRPEFPFGDMRPGDIVTVKFFAVYTVEEGRITHLKTMTWAPERGVTKAPRLGEHAGQKAAFMAYTKAFSAGLADQYSAFYQPDVRLELSSVGVIDGRQGIVDFYTDMFETVRETLEVKDIVYDEHAIVANVTSVFTAVADAPDFVVGPLKEGESIRVPVMVHYTLKDGLISHIKVARAGEPEHIPAR